MTSEKGSLKVAHVAYLGMSGIAHVIREMLLGLREFGVESLLVAYQRGADVGEIRNSFPAAREIIVGNKRSRIDLRNIWKICRMIRSRDISVVIHHDPRVAIVDALLWRLRRRRGAVPIMVHHSAANILNLFRRFESLLAALMVRWNVVVGSNCVPNGSFLARGFFAKRTVRINNSVSYETKSDKEFSASNPAQLRFVMVGRMVHQKDFMTFIRAVELANEILGAKRIRFDIAGAGPDEGPIRRYCEKLGSSVGTFHGQLSAADAIELIGSADVYVQSSRGEADISTSVLVAMSRGISVICSSCPGIQDDLDGKIPKVALLVEPESVAELAKAIIYLTESQAVRDELSQNGAAYVRKNHGRNSVMAGWFNLLSDLTNECYRP